MDQIAILEIGGDFLVSDPHKSFKTRHNIDEATCAKQDEWF